YMRHEANVNPDKACGLCWVVGFVSAVQKIARRSKLGSPRLTPFCQHEPLNILCRDGGWASGPLVRSGRVPTSRTLALVLRTIEVFETSLVVTLFTRELGKVGALAKGARRPKSALQGGLDLLGVSDIVLIPKASEALDLLTEAAPVERFASLRRDLAALYAGYYVAELLNELTDLHDPHPK